MADVKYGLKTLLESDLTLPPGRKGQLEDLKQKLELAEVEHSPETITALQQALTAFLDEELANETTPEGGDMATETDAGAEDLSAKAAADEYKMYDDEAGEELEEAKRSEARQRAAEADGFAKYSGNAGIVAAEEETKRCEACGQMKNEGLDPNMPAPTMAEAHEALAETKKEETKKESKKKESAKPDPLKALQAEVAQLSRQLKESGMTNTTETKLTEADRKELTMLRVKDREHALRESAQKAITDADVDGLVDIDDLLPLKESQWPVIMKLARNQTPPRGHNYARESEAPRKRGPMTAEDVVNSLRW